LPATDWADLRAHLGPASTVPAIPPAESRVPADEYQAYRASAAFVSQDGRTVQFEAIPAAGPVGSHAAINAIPALRATLATVANDVAAQDNGIAGQDATAADIYSASTHDLAG